MPLGRFHQEEIQDYEDYEDEEDEDVEQQIIFEKLADGTWEKTQDDPDDKEYEIIDPIAPEVVYSHIENLKKEGWKVKRDVDPGFDGLILVKSKEVVSQTRFLQQDLISMSRGERINPSLVYADEPNYVHRADKVSALRKRLARLSERGKFRMVGDDEWERA